MVNPKQKICYTVVTNHVWTTRKCLPKSFGNRTEFACVYFSRLQFWQQIHESFPRTRLKRKRTANTSNPLLKQRHKGLMCLEGHVRLLPDSPCVIKGFCRAQYLDVYGAAKRDPCFIVSTNPFVTVKEYPGKAEVLSFAFLLFSLSPQREAQMNFLYTCNTNVR